MLEMVKAWLDAEANFENPFYDLVNTLYGIIVFVASL